MSRVVVNVAIGSRMGQNYLNGQTRLRQQMREAGEVYQRFYTNGLPANCPTHQQVPYAFKAYALKEAAGYGSTLLWCDCSIVLGARPLADLWEKIERDGYWISRSGWNNYEWTADSAYPDLFPWTLETWTKEEKERGTIAMDDLRAVNKRIEHVTATAFGISIAHPIGIEFLAEYFRLASQTKAFCGPTTNSSFPGAQYSGNAARCAYCGPADVRGHRHDQTAASVIAWRLGMKLSDPPEWFAYQGGETDRTCLVADGRF